MAFAFFDVAGTLVDGNPWRGFLKYEGIHKARLYTTYPFLLPPWWAKKAGMISDARFRQIWIRQMASLLKGMSVEETTALFRWIAEVFMAGQYRDDVVVRLKAHKERGDHVILVSGMFTGLTRQFALHLGADDGIGTELGYDVNDICTGAIVGEGCAGALKPQFLQRYLAERQLAWEEAGTFAYADSYSDVPLLEMADHPVATYPDEGLRTVVQERGWEQIGGGE